MSRRPLGLLGALVLLVPLAACTDKGSDADSTIAVTGTNDECTLATTELTAGDLSFDFENKADQTSELYILREDEEIVGEVENVAPDTSRTLTVDLVAGEYLARCKPGQAGDGITTEFTVTGSGGTALQEPDRILTFDAVDFSYEQLDLSDLKAGETIRFEMTNSGTQPHEFEVLDPQGVAIGEVAAVEAGESGGATVTFNEPGEYSYQCILVDDATDQEHTMLGMKGTFEVAST